MTANIFGGDGIIFLVIALIVLVGGSQLPKLARNVGLAGKEFRKAQQEAEEDAERDKAAKAANASTAANDALPPPPALAPAGLATPTQPAQAGPAGQAPQEGTISLTPAQLEALLKAREEQARSESSRPQQ
ncbi:MAG TPA: twin-arginine translocase TatA/TatE family subunit [Acidimicrobiales bacterium]|nr:twin-arginine translocase TatA/TatE family subunit [Acidimicrobiales bacterium]